MLGGEAGGDSQSRRGLGPASRQRHDRSIEAAQQGCKGADRAGAHDIDAIWRDIQVDHIRKVPIGCHVRRYDVGKPAHEFGWGGLAVWRAIDWMPFEISAAPVGTNAVNAA